MSRLCVLAAIPESDGRGGGELREAGGTRTSDVTEDLERDVVSGCWSAGRGYSVFASASKTSHRRP